MAGRAKRGVFARAALLGQRQLQRRLERQHHHHHHRYNTRQRRQTDAAALEAALETILAGSAVHVSYAVRDPDVDGLRATCVALAHHLVLLRSQFERFQHDLREIHQSLLSSLFSRDHSASSGPDSFEPALSVPRTRAMAAMGTPVLDNFLASVAELVRDRDGVKLQDFLQIEPPLPDIYRQLADELKSHYPAGPQGDAELLKRCETLVPRGRGAGSPWTPFPAFMKLYLTFLRDVNVENLLETYNMLKGLLK